MLVRSRRLELPRAFAHNDLNVARLPFRHDRTVMNRVPLEACGVGKAAPLAAAVVGRNRDGGCAKAGPAMVNHLFTIIGAWV